MVSFRSDHGCTWYSFGFGAVPFVVACSCYTLPGTIERRLQFTAVLAVRMSTDARVRYYTRSSLCSMNACIGIFAIHTLDSTHNRTSNLVSQINIRTFRHSIYSVCKLSTAATKINATEFVMIQIVMLGIRIYREEQTCGRLSLCTIS